MQQNTKIAIGSDHAGLDLKTKIIAALKDLKFIDVGPLTSESVDYPDYADKVCAEIVSGTAFVGVLICGSGQGMAIRANRFKGIRAALAWNIEVAQLARKHNNANVLCLGSRVLPHGLAIDILRTFLSTNFEGDQPSGSRHLARVQKLDK